MKEEIESLKRTIESQGFEYAIENYASDIDDEYWRDLLIIYSHAKSSLENYLENNGYEDE